MMRLKNNYLLLANLVLALALGFRLVTLSRGLNVSGQSATQIEASRPVELTLQKVELLAAYRPLFALKEKNSSEKKDDKDNTAIKEIEIDQGVVRLQGIFVTNQERAAVFTFVDKGKRGTAESGRYAVGDKLSNYKVVAIDLSSVTLVKDGGEPVILQMFSHD